MENKLKVYPVMLPSNNVPWEPQELYLVSNREIKEGNFYYHTITKTVEKAIHCQGKSTHPYPKVEATTDKSLGLPLIPESFIKEWVEKQGKIEYVYIRMEDKWDEINGIVPNGNPMLCQEGPNRTVIILPTKDSWNREEVKEIARAAFYYGIERWQAMGEGRNIPTLDEWFDKNY